MPRESATEWACGTWRSVYPLPKEPSSCVSCHDKENSPQFDFEAYRAKIVVPGHGIKLDGGVR